MSDTKELLVELAAKAMGYQYTKPADGYDGSLGLCIGSNPMRTQDWNPEHKSGDAAEMCAALGIDTEWLNGVVRCGGVRLNWRVIERFSKHNNDRAAAWRMAALRVAAAIGEAMR